VSPIRFLRSVLQQRSLARGLGAGLLALAAVWLIPSSLSGYSRAIIAWDVAALVASLSVWRLMSRQTDAQMRVWSEKLEASQRTVLALCLIAAAAALLTIVEMRLTKTDQAVGPGVRSLLVVVTVALSWLFVQTVFALDYIHEFFARDAEGRDCGGLAFPGDEAPDFWDFLHFSVIIGATAQTADITIVSKPMRRLVTVHAVIAFSFNAVILALTINLTAGLLG
jgi:uncharacterized membrane protein